MSMTVKLSGAGAFVEDLPAPSAALSRVLEDSTTVSVEVEMAPDGDTSRRLAGLLEAGPVKLMVRSNNLRNDLFPPATLVGIRRGSGPPRRLILDAVATNPDGSFGSGGPGTDPFAIRRVVHHPQTMLDLFASLRRIVSTTPSVGQILAAIAFDDGPRTSVVREASAVEFLMTLLDQVRRLGGADLLLTGGVDEVAGTAGNWLVTSADPGAAGSLRFGDEKDGWEGVDFATATLPGSRPGHFAREPRLAGLDPERTAVRCRPLETLADHRPAPPFLPVDGLGRGAGLPGRRHLERLRGVRRSSSLDHSPGELTGRGLGHIAPGVSSARRVVWRGQGREGSPERALGDGSARRVRGLGLGRPRPREARQRVERQGRHGGRSPDPDGPVAGRARLVGSRGSFHPLPGKPEVPAGPGRPEIGGKGRDVAGRRFVGTGLCEARRPPDVATSGARAFCGRARPRSSGTGLRLPRARPLGRPACRREGLPPRAGGAIDRPAGPPGRGPCQVLGEGRRPVDPVWLARAHEARPRPPAPRSPTAPTPHLAH